MPRLKSALVRAVLILAGGVPFASSANADGPALGLPVDCDPGRSCWIVNYVDHDPGPGIRDYMCGKATYNLSGGQGHQGTDFAIRDRGAMRAGVPVLAATDGTVKAVRDGMADRVLTKQNAREIAGRDCGNGVVVEHGGDWTTQYCHLREGSVAVRPGQAVSKGYPIGMIGLSGMTQYPHLHITVRKGDRVIDPFVGETRDESCGAAPNPLWDEAVAARLPYQPTAIYNAGFAPEKPTTARIRNGDYRGTDLPVSASALVLWTEMFNVRAGDRIALRIRRPGGETLVEHADTLTKDQARRFVFAGKPLRGGAWPAGRYTGIVELTRDDGTLRLVEERDIVLR